MPDPNAEQERYWNDVAGPNWVRFQERMDREISAHGLAAIERAAPRAGEAVIDVGCGCGDTALELARRVGSGGRVTGFDLSQTMLARARERAAAARHANLSFLHGDAQTFAFPPSSADLLFSRFGVMFFADPVAAFANLRGALRPGGRVAFVCWQRLQDNPWVHVPLMSFLPLLPPAPPPPPDAPGPFAFADAERVRGILARAGFEAIQVQDLRVQFALGAGLDDAVGFLLEMGPASGALRAANADDALRARAADAIREALRPHVRDGAVSLPSAAWVFTARQPA